MWHYCDVNHHHLAKVVFARFFHCKVDCFSFFVLYSLEASHCLAYSQVSGSRGLRIKFHLLLGMVVYIHILNGILL